MPACSECPAADSSATLGLSAAPLPVVFLQVGDAPKVVAAAAAQGVNLRQVSTPAVSTALPHGLGCCCFSHSCKVGREPSCCCHRPPGTSLAKFSLQLDASSVTVSIDETTTLADVDQLFTILNGGKGELCWAF